MTSISRRSTLRGLGAAATAAAGWSSTAVAQATKTVTFGGSVALTGRAAESGGNLNAGYNAAVKFLNEELGGVDIGGTRYKFALQLFDDASDPARAQTLIQKQVDDGIRFFLGSYGSNIVLPTAAITEAEGALMVQCGAASDQIFLQGHKNIFGLFPRASRLWASTVEFFKTLQPTPPSISIVATNDVFSKSNADGAVAAFKAAGFPILDVYQLPEQISDVSSVLASLRAKRPDILVCTTTDQNSLFIARQMVSTNTNVSLLYQILGPQLDVYRETLGKAAEGICVQQYWDVRIASKDPFFGSPERFLQYYTKVMPRPATYHTVGGVACIEGYVLAMLAAASIEPAKVRDQLAKANFETVYGPVKFTPEGDGDPIVMGPRIGQVKSRQVEMVYPPSLATAKTQFPVPAWSEKT